MKLWILSDWHRETRLSFMPPRPEFDVLVAAGDIDDTIERAIIDVGHVAGGKPAVYVAGNHEWWGDRRTLEEKLAAAHETAARYGVHFLECDTCEISGVRFAGATLWTPDNPLFMASAVALTKADADVVVTHFEPPPGLIMPALPTGGVWVYGHHHGHSVRRLGERTLIRNALGYANEPTDWPPPILDYVFEI
jgi:predicted phosphodiesterase